MCNTVFNHLLNITLILVNRNEIPSKYLVHTACEPNYLVFLSLIAKFRLKLKKVKKTTRPFWYDLNQILYGYTVEMTNRFKGLDLIECLKNSGWRFVKRWWPKSSPWKRNAKRQNGCLRRPYKWLRKEEKPKAKEKRIGIYPPECRVPKNSKER